VWVITTKITRVTKIANSLLPFFVLFVLFVAFVVGRVLDTTLGPINRSTFDARHARAVREMIEREPRLNVGWATKIINVYLKTRAYIGAQGRHHLKEMIHPPIDAHELCQPDKRHRL
jgi:hypothetical protein